MAEKKKSAIVNPNINLYFKLMEANAEIILMDGEINQEFWEESQNIFHLIRSETKEI